MGRFCFTSVHRKMTISLFRFFIVCMYFFNRLLFECVMAKNKSARRCCSREREEKNEKFDRTVKENVPVVKQFETYLCYFDW